MQGAWLGGEGHQGLSPEWRAGLHIQFPAGIHTGNWEQWGTAPCAVELEAEFTAAWWRVVSKPCHSQH